ncbi:MAG: hypothetical protein AABX99_00615 [Nanoarchaeota archaeon]
MKDKRGFLLGEETLKIIIAVIGIVFLVFLLASVYFNLTGAQDKKYADASMNNILLKEVARVNSGAEVKPEGIQIPNPAGWDLLSFVQGDKRPNSCTGQDCICLCQDIKIDIFDRQIKNCDDKGVCSVIPNLKKFDKITIGNSGTWISVQKINDEIVIAKK